MKVNPILEEVWRVKAQLVAEAGYDADRCFAQLGAWSEAHPHTGPVVRNAEELRRLAAEEPTLALKDKPPPKDAAASGVHSESAGVEAKPARVARRDGSGSGPNHTGKGRKTHNANNVFALV